MSRPLYPRERAPGTHWIGGWVDPRLGPDDVEKTKFLPLLGLELRRLARPGRSQSLYRLRYCRLSILRDHEAYIGSCVVGSHDYIIIDTLSCRQCQPSSLIQQPNSIQTKPCATFLVTYSGTQIMGDGCGRVDLSLPWIKKKKNRNR
jgi:hypothetical protein